MAKKTGKEILATPTYRPVNYQLLSNWVYFFAYMSSRLNSQPLKVLAEDLEADIICENDVRTRGNIVS
jgi:hypothetical protein